MKRFVIGLTVAVFFATSGWSKETPVYLDEEQPLELRVEDALSRMTLEEKVALCHAVGKFTSPGVPRLGIKEIWMSDGPHGVRHELSFNTWNPAGWTIDSVTVFPALTALAATWNPSLSRLYGEALGEEALYREKDVLLGPGVNIYRTPLNGRNFEYMGEDPYLASVMVAPYIEGMQSNGVAACVKHFALNNQEKWRGSTDVHLSDRALYEIYLPAFKSAVDAGVWSVMGSYNKYNGQHACHNERLLNDILKGEWEFDGVVITDWGGAHDTKEAALNGLDIEMGSYTNGLTTEGTGFTYDDYYLAAPYLEMLKSGELPVSTVDDKARRILRLIFRTSMNHKKGFGSLTSPEHYAAVKKIGDEAVVLMKNEKVNGSPLLPISPAGEGTILVVGDNAVRELNKGGGSSELKAKDMVSPLEGMKEVYGSRIKFAQGYAAGKPLYNKEEVIPHHIQDSLRREAVEMAKDAEYVVVFGGLNKNGFQDSESTDRKEYGLPFAQPELIEELAKVNPNIVLVLLSGNAVEMPWIDDVPALLQGWYLGTMGGETLAGVISGDVNPSGKLPFSFPVKLEDNGAHYYGETSYPGIDQKQEYLEDILVGYRWHDTKRIPSLFPFGHGLSYTDFTYGEIQKDRQEISEGENITISIPVTNTGDVAGKEVVQLYIGDDKASVTRPLKELKDFAKIELMPGETKTVTFTVSTDALKFFDDKKHEWVAEPGSFTAYVGSSSGDIRGKTKFKLK